MTLHDVQRLSNYWRQNLPLTILVSACASALGVKLPSAEEPDKKYLTAEEFGALVRQTDGLRVM